MTSELGWMGNGRCRRQGKEETVHGCKPVMLSPQGQVGLEAKILSLSSSSKICPRPRLGLEYLSSSCPWTFHLGLVKVFVMLVLLIFLSVQWLVNCITYLLMSMVVVMK